MSIEEIIQYIEMSSIKSIIVDRSGLIKYPGYIREMVIAQKYVVRLEFNIYNQEYGGLKLYFHYSEYRSLISSLESYLDKSIEQWENINKTGFYPTISEPYNISVSDQLLKNDFTSNNLALPKGYSKKIIPEGYWKDLYDEKNRSVL